MLKTKYNTDKTELENKIPNTSGLIKKTDCNTKIIELKVKFLILVVLLKKTNYNTKIAELENNIPDISSSATKISLRTIQNKIPSINNLVKKKQAIILKLQKSKINLIITIMINILTLQSLMN